MFGLEDRRRRRGLRALAFTALTIALLVYVWWFTDDVAIDDLDRLLFSALIIIGVQVTLNGLNDLAKTIAVDTPWGKIRAGCDDEEESDA